MAVEDGPRGSGGALLQVFDEPMSADIARWLDEHPAELPAVRAAMRRAGRWLATNGTTWVPHPLDGRSIGSASYGLDAPDTWSWWAGEGHEQQRGRTASKGEALGEIRRVLRQLGWTLE